MNKSPILAFFLSFIPGFGHIYLGKPLRGVLYLLLFLGACLSAFAIVMTPFHTGEAVFLAMVAVLLWGVNLLDMVVSLLSQSGSTRNGENENGNGQGTPVQNERFFTTLLSFIPGVGHFYLGLNQRGLTFMTAFFGTGIMIFFVALLSSQSVFLIFLLALPIIWIYNMFDTIQHLNRKSAGEELEDRTLMDDLEWHREDGQKNKMVATVLSMFPGAGHLYLGLQKRGLQLMAGFLLSIYILDVLHLSLFLFLIPIIWFFSFFDGLQQTHRVNQGDVEDKPIVTYFVNQQRLIGIALLLLGGYYLLDALILPAFAEQLQAMFNVDIWYYYQRYFQIGLISFLFIGGGLWLILKSRQTK
ncbi:hypothetical protein [Thalassobacillus sp. CUG 92003]|uniref:hypothetical protein n=1 Tax=Thalassobacillus sp. CUG 92003 TaxID=2736641 RepID=UPI0015E69B21|nr:hypothetical protein [Thalassobacillus sp. CUG 92003]